MKPSIRAIGVMKNNELLTFDQASQRERDDGSWLREINLGEIRDHLIMIYFLDFEPREMDQIIERFEHKYKLKLNYSVDKRGTPYYWREGSRRKKVLIQRRNVGYSRNGADREISRQFWIRKNPQVAFMQDADR